MEQPGVWLGVRLSPGGHCSFVVRYRVGGRLRRFTIGLYPRISLAGARETARDALRDAHHGKDRAVEKIEARRAETFAELASEYIEPHASKKRSGGEDIRLLNGSPHKKKTGTGKTPHVPIVKRWGSRKVKDIQRRDVRALLDEIAARAPITVNRTLALVRKMFNFAIEHDWLEANPCHMVKRVAPERQRDRVLSEDEVRRLWKALDSEDAIIAAVFRPSAPDSTARRGGAWCDVGRDGPDDRLVDDSGCAEQERLGAPRAPVRLGAQGAEVTSFRDGRLAVGLSEPEERRRQHRARAEGDRAGRGTVRCQL